MNGAETGTETGAIESAAEAAEAQPNEPVESGATKCPNGPPAVDCPTDFVIEAPDRILCVHVKGNGPPDWVGIAVRDLPGAGGGVFKWKTASANIVLSQDTGRRIQVVAGEKISAGRDAEVIEVTRHSPGCGPVTKQVKLTVARLTFSKASDLANAYGYDDMDGGSRLGKSGVPFHYVSIREKSTSAVQVTIEGGLLGTDFKFECASSRSGRCKPMEAPAQASFELGLVAGDEQPAQVLQAKVNQPNETVMGEMGVTVYREKKVKVVIGKFKPPAEQGKLQFGTTDFAAHEGPANAKLRQGVVKYELHNMLTDPAVAVEVEFSSKSDVLTYDIGKGGGPDVDKLKMLMTGKTKVASTLTPGTGNMYRVALVPKMRSIYKLITDVKAKDTRVPLSGRVHYKEGQTHMLNGEPITIVTIEQKTNTLIVHPLKNDHAKDSIMLYSAGAWSSDPIIIQEGSAGVDVAKWTILHEVGHRALSLTDIEDQTNFMHWQQAWTDYRLRFCPRKVYRSRSGVQEVENQWQRIPRNDLDSLF